MLPHMRDTCSERAEIFKIASITIEALLVISVKNESRITFDHELSVRVSKTASCKSYEHDI